ANPAPVWLVILDNALYEVTGGQPPAGAGRTDFAAMAQAAGIGRAFRCTTRDEWEAAAPEALSGAGPCVVVLATEGRMGQRTPKPPRPMAEQIARLREALGT
ncbi:MAG: hypothetical protein K2W96_09930, partial [Gemmataceae bacterium]|nr:hypothetical protein [Gemmataceae bacterium]